MVSKSTTTPKAGKEAKKTKVSKTTSSPKVIKKRTSTKSLAKSTSSKTEPAKEKSVKSPPAKSTPAKGLEDNDESDLDLENEVDEENALNELEEQALKEGTRESEDEDANLLEGFSSDSSDSDTETEHQITLPPVPTNREKKLAKKAAKKTAANVSTPSKPGTVFLGHIPHGFFERQMQEYFSQFGTVTRLRLSRNRRTGKSKHYGWVEFSSHDVAEIVAETMDGYLIHPHRMVCKVVEVDENVWKGANRVFKKIPWVRINREKLEAKRTQEGWEGIVQRDEEKTRKRAEKIKELGIEYDAPVRGEKRKAEKVAAPESEKKGKTQKVGKEKIGKRVASASKEKSKSKA